MKTNNIFYLLPFAICFLPCRPSSADSPDTSLYQDSIHATKQSIAHETLDAFYHDAIDYYNDRQYDQALEFLDKIYSIDPHYSDVAALRETIRKKQSNSQMEATLTTVRDWMKKGDQAESSGQKVLAISYWKKALDINPNYEPAQKKILAMNQALAQKEFEAGYIHYHHGELEDALESWSNAVALDPTYKQRGLLMRMSQIQLQIEHDQVARLAAQGFDQYQQGQLEDALQTYQELSTLEPRHEEARRMTAKIKIQLGQTAFKAAKTALAAHDYPGAIEQADKAIQYGYEVSHGQDIKNQAQHAMDLAKLPKPPHKVAKRPAVAVSSATAAAPVPPVPPAPTQPANPEEALVHYRQGMAAIRRKDYHLAVDELTIASQLNPSDERIYMARERARQEWAAMNAGSQPQ